jgi:hypothetical protein
VDAEGGGSLITSKCPMQRWPPVSAGGLSRTLCLLARRAGVRPSPARQLKKPLMYSRRLLGPGLSTPLPPPGQQSGIPPRTVADPTQSLWAS